MSHAILNRVTYVPDKLFEKFTVEDREYAKREFEAYIGFSFNSFLGLAKNGQLIQYAALIKKVPNKIIQTFVGIGKSFLIVIMMSCAHKI